MLAALALAAAAPVEAGQRACTAAVRHYYAAIDRREYDTAHAIWSTGETVSALRARYADAAHLRLAVAGPVHVEGAAGSLYCEVTVRVTAIHRDGVYGRANGRYTLRRANDVEGATPAQRRWHIVSASLDALP